MTFLVSITGCVGHAVREARKILNTTKSKRVVVVSGRLIWSRYKVCAFAKTWSAADTPPKSIIVMMEPMIIPPNIFTMRVLLSLKTKIENFWLLGFIHLPKTKGGLFERDEFITLVKRYRERGDCVNTAKGLAVELSFGNFCGMIEFF